MKMRSTEGTPLILNVNDSEEGRYAVTLMLEHAGFDVIEAETGMGALEAVERSQPDLVVLDVQLPDLDGFEVCRRIRANPETSSIKVLHTSATYVASDNKVQSLEGGADGYLAQPFEAEELIATVASLLRLKRAEQALRQDAEHLREADRRKDEFLSMLAHELRNPLAAISAALPLLERRPPLDEIEQRAREVLQRQTYHLGRLIDDLLDVARVTQGKIELKWEAVNLLDLLRRVADNALQTKIQSRGQQLHLEIGGPPLYVRGDVTRLEQVFTNLLDNAAKYTDPGGSIGLAVAHGTDGMARVRVRDSGIGMAAETLPTIFALFSQADVPISRSRGGLGIGLTLVRTLVELHGGEVAARSNGLGQGSEFEVTLPTLGSAEVGALPRERGRDLSSSLHSRRVLLVEDNLDAQEMLADLIELWGHEIRCASDGPEGVSLALTWMPDVVLVDIGLPGMDGYEVARRIKRGLNGHRPTLIALTGYGSPEQKARSLEAGFDMHLVKPVNAAHLEMLLAARSAESSHP